MNAIHGEVEASGSELHNAIFFSRDISKSPLYTQKKI